MHGSGGEWRVEEQRLSWDILDKFRAACIAAGIPAIDDFNRGNNEGVGFFRSIKRRGWRWSSSKAFLAPARGAESDCADRCNCPKDCFDRPQGCRTAVHHHNRVALAGCRREVFYAVGPLAHRSFYNCQALVRLNFCRATALRFAITAGCGSEPSRPSANQNHL